MTHNIDIPEPWSEMVTIDSLSGPTSLDVTSLKGKWVAISYGRVVACARELDDVMEVCESRAGFVEYQFIRPDIVSIRNRKCMRMG